MKQIKDILFISNIREKSSRIKKKIIRPFNDSNLLEIGLKKIKKSNIIPSDNFYIACNEKSIENIVKKHGINIYSRSNKSLNEPIMISDIFEWAFNFDKQFTYYIYFNFCNPLISIKTIDNFISRFLETKSKGMFAVVGKRAFYCNKNSQIVSKFLGDIKYLSSFETKLVEPLYVGAGLHAGTIEDIKKNIYMGSFTKKNDPELFIIPNIEFMDIDEPWQFEIAEVIFEKHKKEIMSNK